MKIRPAGGVVASGRHAWTARPSGPARLLDQAGAAGGVVAAGAGVDLGAGFRSARLDGAHGDQRDAVLAALRVVGVDGAHRLGQRAGFLVALFGPSVTRRVGAAAARAVEEERWAALHLASAASDVLGPEQLERVLERRHALGGRERRLATQSRRDRLDDLRRRRRHDDDH
ncbi:hypothetical protein [Actinomadura bangladeshensis]|uniref:Uncharacterized protein n=1 Tax=Actinomadura bangladeshensis TaxID=453573 RepID=A0A4R4PCD4_9ACTN|nr:hypothetical protein [Actinomadura bangladeshensis]TDC18687.1 hypothetical protein E1284_05845 [Actinomadura bangladeshensis]